jgi:phosphoserine phosphatase RsbU/P
MKKIRVLATDNALLQQLASLHGEPEYILGEPGAEDSWTEKADLFLLDETSARRILTSDKSEDSRRPFVAVLAKDGQNIPETFREGLADDLFVLPPRALEIEQLLRHFELVHALRELEQSSSAIPGLVRKLQEDIQLAEKIQRRLIREKFPPLGPLSIKSKYWCGLKSGGDYFDIFEFPGGTHAGIILSDSSSYSLSTSLINALMHFSLQVGKDELEDPARILGALFAKVRDGMKEKDRLSILYGVLDRRTFAFHYVCCGSLFVLQRKKNGELVWSAAGEQPPLSLDRKEIPPTRTLPMEPGERLLLASDGWAEAIGQPVPPLLERMVKETEGDGQDLFNSMAFELRRHLEATEEESEGGDGEFPMPPQDCSVLLFELAANALRLAR